MKKFLIILCGILTIGDANAKVNKSNYANYWGASSNTNDYTTNEENLFAAKDRLKQNEGTYGSDEGAVVVVMARNIYENGARICTTQIQHANRGGDFKLTYHAKENYECETVCKDGYSGADCSKHEYDECDPSLDYQKIFGNVIFNKDFRITSGGDDSLIDEDIDVFTYDDNPSEKRKPYAIVLGVVGTFEHSLWVKPVLVRGDANGRWSSWIDSVTSNDKRTILCAPGYQLSGNGGNGCVPSAKCQNSTKESQLCDKYKSVYNSELHTISNTKTNDGCYTISCRGEGYGFNNDVELRCVECPGGELAYVNSDGLCAKCDKGKYHKNGDNCTGEMTSYNKDMMKSNETKQCWLETSATEFYNCVIGNN